MPKTDEYEVVTEYCCLNSDRPCDDDCPAYLRQHSQGGGWRVCVLLRSFYRLSEATVKLACALEKVAGGVGAPEEWLEPPKIPREKIS